MDRRSFLAAGGLAAVAPAFAATGVPAGVDGRGPAPFTRVRFDHDGLGLDPREYALVLQELAADPAFAADDYSQGGALAALEARFAAALGKPAAIWMPTGTLANHLAVRLLAGDARRVLVQADSHLYNDSGDAATALSGLNLVPLGDGPEGLTADEVEHWIRRSAGGRVETRIGAIVIESPLRRRDHAALPFAQVRAISELARRHGIAMHFDGARAFSLPLHTGHALAEWTALFDTVYVSTWKHFNAAAGAMLAGDAARIDALFHPRRMFGGGLPAAWPLAAPAGKYLDRFAADYAASWRAAEALIAGLERDGAFSVRRVANGTTRFHLRVRGDAAGFARHARAEGIGLVGPRAGGEFPMQVNPSVLRRPVDELVDTLRRCHAATR